MRVPRFFTRQTLSPGQPVTLELPPSHHLLRVLRAQPGAAAVLFNGDGREYQAVLQGTDGKHAVLDVTTATEPRRESPLVIRLGQGVSRGERMDWVIQKSVELGVREITPLWTLRSQVQLSGKRLDKRLSHWEGIATSASEQSGRVELTEICQATRLTKWIGQPDDGMVTRIVLDPDADATLGEMEAPAEVRVLVGPEGGLERGEIEMAINAGFVPVRLGPRTLRTETAALATVASIQMLWGDFGN